MEKHDEFMKLAISLALSSIESGGGPFGAVVVKDGEVVAEGSNSVTLNNDPTAHAEVVAIRNACTKLGSFQLEGCVLYTSCEPCPMCLGAIYWARPSKVYYSSSKIDAAKIGFDDQFIYEQLELQHENRDIPFVKVEVDNTGAEFAAWENKEDKIEY